ncbi:MAG: hypothetical protein M3438_04105 [Pseudomonadota bacterium]|nr:hypothetical protein [Pseudomonadota bacterium]
MTGAASGDGLYPSYVDLDSIIDVHRLRSLDGCIRERLQRRLAAERDLAFYTGPFVLDEQAPTLPGSRLVYLARSDRPDDYYDLNQCEHWSASKEAEEFPELMELIATLPFAATARMMIMYDPDGSAVTAHRDHVSTELCHEFIWMRTNRDKPFYVLDPESGEKRYIAGHSAWFDTVNQYHGADATGELAWSIRIDGRFTDEFRALMPTAAENPASRAALWAKWGTVGQPG